MCSSKNVKPTTITATYAPLWCHVELELIEEKGIRALTLREIGKRLGVSRTAAYAHFKDKAALLAAISEAGFIEFVKAMEAAQKGVSGFAAQMDAMSIAYFRFAQEHPAHFRVCSTRCSKPAAAWRQQRRFSQC